MSKQTDLINVTDAITVSGSNVGIGTSSPDQKVHISGAGTQALRIENTNTNLIVGSVVGSVEFEGNDLGASGVTAAVKAVADSVVGKAALVFDTGTAGSASEAMRIDSSGRVTTPYQPAFMAHAGGDTAFTAAQNAWTDFSVFGTVNHNRGNHWNTSTRRFTCPVAGVYHFYINVREETYYGSWGGIRLQLAKNGVRFAEIRKWDGYQDEETLAISITVECAANDIIHSRIHSDSSDTSLRVEGSNTTFFGGYLIG